MNPEGPNSKGAEIRGGDVFALQVEKIEVIIADNAILRSATLFYAPIELASLLGKKISG
ncbi:MAG: hypothetical protein ACI82A_003440 [Candidatus Azotimanducaceae bacterium]